MCCELGRGVCICQVKEWEGSVMIWSSGFLKSCYYCLPGLHRCVAFYSAASVNWWTFWNLSWVTWLPSVKLQRSPWCFWGYALDVVHLLKNIPNSSNLLTLVTSLKLKLAMATFLHSVMAVEKWHHLCISWFSINVPSLCYHKINTCQITTRKCVYHCTTKTAGDIVFPGPCPQVTVEQLE